MILVTGGAGFIGSNFILNFLKQSDERVINLDKLTYAGNMDNLSSLQDDERHVFVRGDIADRRVIKRLLESHAPRAIIHFAAETHVDRSIYEPEPFLDTNVGGTLSLLTEATAYWNSLEGEQKERFCFIHVSTDEVFGSLGKEDEPFTEDSKYVPNSPYSASKAASDHMVRAYNKTYGLPTLVTHCSNNYGPYQFPEKLIPLVISRALGGEAIPLYGDGQQERNWIYVDDHCQAICKLLESGKQGEVYNIGAERSRSNKEVVQTVCSLLDDIVPKESSYSSLITHVEDRPGHDLRYDIDSSKIDKHIGWQSSVSFDEGMRKTVMWYIENELWLNRVLSGEHAQWVKQQYGE